MLYLKEPKSSQTMVTITKIQPSKENFSLWFYCIFPAWHVIYQALTQSGIYCLILSAVLVHYCTAVCDSCHKLSNSVRVFYTSLQMFHPSSLITCAQNGKMLLKNCLHPDVILEYMYTTSKSFSSLKKYIYTSSILKYLTCPLFLRINQGSRSQ